MLLKIEVFPAGEPLRSTSSSGNNKDTLDASPTQQLPIEPSSSQPPLYVCLATSGKPASKLLDDDDDDDDDIASDYVDPDAGRLLTVGRSKVTTLAGTATAAAVGGDKPMVLIPASDKTVSREHCVLRLVCSKTAMETNAFPYHPRPMPSRNDQEEEACCQGDATNLCVVVEGIGKLGTFLVVEPQPADDDDAKDTPSKKAAKNKDNDSEDDETDDDEDPSSYLPVSQQQQQTQQSKSQSGGLLQLPPLSEATKQIVGPKNVPGTTLLPIEHSLVLEALSNSTTTGTRGRVILQCGKVGSTIVITRVPVHFVQASGVSSSSSSSSRKSKTSSTTNIGVADAPWYKRLYMMGATEGETVTWNDDSNNKDHCIMPTTLVLTAAYNATPKQLAAWSRGLPLVTPDFMQALLQRCGTNPYHDSLPKFRDFTPKADDNAFWNKTANARLWSNTVFLSSTQDTSSSSSKKSSSSSSNGGMDVTEMLVSSAGATIVRLYEMSTEQLQDVAHKLETDTAFAQCCFGLQQSSSSSSGSGRGVRRTKKSSTATTAGESVVAVAAAKLLQDFNIPLFSTRNFAKMLTEQQPLTTPEGRVIGPQDGSSNSSSSIHKNDDSAKLPEMTSTLPMEETMRMEKAASRRVQEKDKDVEMQQVLPETPSPQMDSSSKRRRRDEPQESSNNSSNSASQQREEESPASLLLLKKCSKKQRHLSPVEEEPVATTTAAAATAASKNDKEALRTVGQQSQGSGGEDKEKRNATSSSKEINQDKDSNDKNKQEKAKSKSNKENTKDSHHQQYQQQPGKRCSLAASTTKQGWLVALPSTDSKRQAYLRSRSEIQEQGGYQELLPVAETEVVKGLLRSTNIATGSGQRQQRLGTSSNSTAAVTGPDFKRFWKNEIAGQEPIAASAYRRGTATGRFRRPRFVMKLSTKNKGDSVLQMEFHEERQAVEEEQRKADLLFCDPGTASAAAPRRRRKD